MQEVKYIKDGDFETTTSFSRREEMREKFTEQLHKAREESGNQIVSVRRHRVKLGRNDSCPCGSGKKFKKCCL